MFNKMWLKRVMPKLTAALMAICIIMPAVMYLGTSQLYVQAANERYFVMGQVFFTDGTANCNVDGRVVADTAFTVAAAGDFTVYMASGTTGSLSGTNIQGTPVALAAGSNTITATDAVADGAFDITIGTAANWNTINSWSAASGGTGGASVPGSTNSVLFDANSFTAGSQVLTVDAAATCLNMDWTGAANTPTLAGSAALNIYGSRTYIAAMTITYTGTVTYKATAGTQAITSNGKVSLSNTVFNGAGGTFQLADKFTLGGTANLTLTAGTFDANAKEVALNGTAHTITGNFTFTTLTRNGTATKTDTLTITAGATITCTTFAMIGNSATNRLQVRTSDLGTAATVTATNWTGSANCDLRDITATNAVDLSAITGGSGDTGGNTNVTFTTAAAQISAATGNWSTLATWQDGVGTDRVPLPQDDVSCSHTVTVDMPRIGKNITFTGTPVVTLGTDVYHYGSLTLVAGMTYTHASFVNYAGGRGAYNLTTAGKAIYAFLTRNPGGTTTLQDNYTSTAGYISHAYGTLDLNDKNVSVSRFEFNETYTRALYLGDGTLTVSNNGGTPWYGAYTGLTFDAEGSTVIVTGSNGTARTFAGGSLAYNNVQVAGTGAFVLTITGDNSFNTFTANANQAAKAITATGTTQIAGDFTRNTGTNVATLTNGTWSKHGRLVNGSGTFTGSPVYFDDLSETITCTGNGTAIVYLPYGVTGTATSGAAGATVTDSPKALVEGRNSIDVTTGGDNTFTIATNSIDSIPIALDYLNVIGSTAVPANVWYAGSHSSDGGGNAGWLFTDPALSVTSAACTGITMDKDGVTGGTFNGTIDTLLEGTPTITTYFEYGLTDAYGAQTANVIIYADGAFTGTIPAALTPGATYHYRAVATNGNAGSPFNGADATFTFTMPTITTTAVTNAQADAGGTSATLNGNVANMGAASSVYGHFEYSDDGNLTYEHSTPDVTIIGAGNVTANIAHFDPNYTINYRFVVESGAVASNGANQSFAVNYNVISLANIIPIIAVAVIIMAAIAMLAAGLTLPALVTLAIGLIMSLSFLPAIISGLNNMW